MLFVLRPREILASGHLLSWLKRTWFRLSSRSNCEVFCHHVHVGTDLKRLRTKIQIKNKKLLTQNNVHYFWRPVHITDRTLISMKKVYLETIRRQEEERREFICSPLTKKPSQEQEGVQLNPKSDKENVIDNSSEEGMSPWRLLLSVPVELTEEDEEEQVFLFVRHHKETRKRFYGRCEISCPSEKFPIKAISKQEKYEYAEMIRTWKKKANIDALYRDLPPSSECEACNDEEGFGCVPHSILRAKEKRKLHNLGPVQDEFREIVAETFDSLKDLKEEIRNQFSVYKHPHGFSREFLIKMQQKFTKYSHRMTALAAREPPIKTLEDSQ